MTVKHKTSIAFLLVLTVVFLLTGCRTSDNKNSDDKHLDQKSETQEPVSGEKQHIWKIFDNQKQEIGQITDANAIEKLDKLLNCNENYDENQWSRTAENVSDRPDDPLYTYVYCQQRTLLAGENPDTEREYQELIQFTISASEDIITEQINDQSLKNAADKLPEDLSETLPEELSESLPEDLLKVLSESLSGISQMDLSELLTISIEIPAEDAVALREPSQFLGVSE